MISALRSVIRSGWVPAALVMLVAAVLLRQGAAVSLTDTARFAGYLAIWLVLPGTLVWRAVDPRREPRPLVEDLAVGALLGYVLEFPAYLLCLAVGMPQLYLGWPAVVVLATVAHRRGRALWRRPVLRMPVWWTWTMAGLLAYLVVWFGHNVWGPAPIQAASLRKSYVDEPFHLSLATGLKNFFPPEVTYVADTPLHYHWLSHLHVAAGSWVTGIEAVALIRALALPALFVLCALAAATMAVRLTGAAWTGPAAVVSVLLVPSIHSGWHPGAGDGLLSVRLMVSPSAGFVNAAILLGVFLCIELLRQERLRWATLPVLWLTFVAMTGAKSTSLPTLMAGLVAATVICSIAQRRVHRVGATLALLAVTAFAVAKPLFFGAGSHGLSVEPLMYFGVWGNSYPGLLDSDGSIPLGAAAVASISFLGYLSLAGGALVLLTRGGWRSPDTVFLLMTCAAGIGACLTFHQDSYSEFYFAYVILLPLSLAATLGIHRAVEGLQDRVPGRRLAVSMVAVFCIGLVAMRAYSWNMDGADPDSPAGGPVGEAVRIFVLPLLATAAIAVVLTVVLVLVLGRWLGVRKALILPVAVLTLAGLGGATLVIQLHKIPTDVLPAASVRNPDEFFGRGGLPAARWLREHSDVDDLVATNGHCQYPGTEPCAARNFWLAGFSERRVLVEGWSYVSWSSAGKEAPEGQSTTNGPFWDPELLRVNDAAFLEPSESTIAALRDDHDVRWLFVDTRYPVDMDGLREHAELVHRRGVYRVFELD